MPPLWMPLLAQGLMASYNKMKHGWTAAYNVRLGLRFSLGDPDVVANTHRNWSHSRGTCSSPQRVRSWHGSMSAKFVLQWRCNGCEARKEIHDGVCSAIQCGVSRRDALGRLGNGRMRPAAA